MWFVTGSAAAALGRTAVSSKAVTDLSEQRLRSGFRLENWLVEPELDRISRGGEPVHLQPLEMDLLVLLAARAGRVIAPRNLIDAVWEGRIVAESALSRTVAGLRRALGDDAREPRYVETIPRRGYRLVGKVTALEVAPAEQETQCVVLLPDGMARLGQGRHVLGRGSTADVVVEGAKVSRRHASLTVDGAQVVLEDLGSKHGTWVDGRPVTAPVTLGEGAVILLAGVVVQFRWLHQDETTV
jgi:DNA-binding winged helix-turn-helix (wHTH) protein